MVLDLGASNTQAAHFTERTNVPTRHHSPHLLQSSLNLRPTARASMDLVDGLSIIEVAQYAIFGHTNRMFRLRLLI